jgi:hypothetical protein
LILPKYSKGYVKNTAVTEPYQPVSDKEIA